MHRKTHEILNGQASIPVKGRIGLTLDHSTGSLDGQTPPGVPPPVDTVKANGSSHLRLHSHDSSVMKRGGNAASADIILDD